MARHVAQHRHSRGAGWRKSRPWAFAAALAAFAIALLQWGLGQGATVASAQPTQTISVSQATLTSCDEGYHFIINQIADTGSKPASITVSWSDGSSTVVALSPPFEPAVAHYDAFPATPGLTVVDATADIYEGWVGNFNLSGCLTGTPPTTSTSPSTTAPDTTGPSTTAPDTTGPRTTGPDTTGPETTGPSTTGPDTTGPSTTGPSTTAPGTTGPSTTGPATSVAATVTPPVTTGSGTTPAGAGTAQLPAGSTASTASSSAVRAGATSPFVPGIGKTQDGPLEGSPLGKWLVICSVLIICISAGVRALLHRGDHS